VRFRQHQDQARAATRRLLLLFLLTVLATVLALNLVLALLWSLQTGNLLAYPRWFFETNSVVCAAFILGGSWIETVQLRRGGAHVAQLVGAREMLVPRDGHEQRLRNVVAEMAIASGLATPRIFVLDRDEAINAFAAGWEQADSVVAVTRGALERLSRDELQGVVAHELSHILHGDARLNMRLIGHVWGLQLLFLLGRDLFGATDARGRRTGFVLMGLGLMVVGSIGWLAGRLLKAAVSRQREFLADAAAVQFTRHKEGIGGALRKIAGQGAQGGPVALHNSRAEVISHMLLSSDIFVHATALATHPPLAERIRRIYGRPMAPLRSAAQDAAPEAGAAAPEQAALPFELAPFVASALPAGGTGHAASDAVIDVGATAAVPARAAPAVPWLDDMLAIAWPHDLAPATLAFLVPAQHGPEHQAWCALFAPAPSTRQEQHLLLRAGSVPAAARQDTFERLLTRCASLPLADRAQLRVQAHQIVRADGRFAFAEIWHCLLLDHVLQLRHDSVLRETHCRALQDSALAIAVVTDLLAQRCCADSADAVAVRAHWRAALQAALGLAQLPDAQWPPSWPAVQAAVRQLAYLSAVLRPQPMKAWCTQVFDLPQPPQELVDALRSLCILIDTPMPPRLLAAWPQRAALSAAA
jgi:Zn-dependent protease with chaperone function